MAPWFTMPREREARQVAARERCEIAVASIVCSLDLLANRLTGARERELLRAIRSELDQLREAMRRL
ncbi:MAG: hypothetical protein ACE5PT_13175 [Gemmatimonadales bacterium]